MYEADKLFSKLKLLHSSSAAVNWLEMRDALSLLVYPGIQMSKKKFTYRKIIKYFKGRKNIKILDFGCGSGQLVLYLSLLGYEHVYGVDVFPQLKNNNFMKELGIDKSLFFEYDKKSLPFQNASFDLVISEQVLEHVFDLDCYYKEAARVLKSNGLAYFSFPHKLIPFDSHSRTWFIHYFPKRFRRYIFRIIGKDYQYYERLLNYRTIRHHKKIASKYFSNISEETKERLLSFDKNDLTRYEGNVFIRSLADRFIKSKIIGSLIMPFLSKISNIDLCLIK